MTPDEALEIHFLNRRIEYLKHPHRDVQHEDFTASFVDEQFRDVKSKKAFLESLQETVADYSDYLHQREGG